MMITPRRDAIVIAVGAALSLLLASLILTGFPAGLKPNLSYPFIYAGDGLFQHWMVQRAIEGWVFENPRSGFPFGAPLFDYPSSDAGNLLVSKLLGLVFGDYVGAANAYALLSFPVAFAAAFWVLRRLEVRRDVSFAAALVFAFTPYHFSRLFYGHTFYTWYFVVPLYVYAGLQIFDLPARGQRLATAARRAAMLLVASCFGVYFAFFGVLTLMFCGVAAAIKTKGIVPLLWAIGFSATISVGVVANVTPNKLYTAAHGTNTEVVDRKPVETEIYALKLTQLVMPHADHRVRHLRELWKTYLGHSMQSNTNASLGVIGLMGLLVIGWVLVRGMTGCAVEPRMGVVALLTVMTLLVSMIGGLNMLFAMAVTPIIRGWDRIAIFIVFYAIVALALASSRKLGTRTLRAWQVAALMLLTLVAIVEQTGRPATYVAYSGKSEFMQDREFIARIENRLPPRAAVYQIPYVGFPETADVHGMGPYSALTGFLNSKTLRWSSGGIKGREADRVYRELDKKPLAEQVETAKRLGFSGIYVDRRGYADQGKAAVEGLTQILGRPPALTRADGSAVFFDLAAKLDAQDQRP